MATHLLACDIDSLLPPGDSTLGDLAEWLRLHRGDVLLAYTSRKFRDEVLEKLVRFEYPEPDAIISGSGTEIYLCPGGNLLEDWEDSLGGAWSAVQIQSILVELPQLKLQPDNCQSRHRVSYWLDNASIEELNEIQELLEIAGFNADLLYTSDHDLDVVPAGASKGSAVAYLSKCWSIERTRVVVAAKSESDRSLFEQGFRGIVVKDSDPGLQKLTCPNIHFADRPCAAGVLEGVRSWYQETAPAKRIPA